MKTTSRNVAVGLFVLAGLTALGWMIIAFSQRRHVLERSYEVRMYFPAAGQVDEGATVRLAGVIVGRVKRVKLVDDKRGHVRVDADIRSDHRIPADVVPVIRTAGVGLGLPSVDLELPDKLSGQTLPQEGRPILIGVNRGFAGLVPESVQVRLAELQTSLLKTSDALTLVGQDLHELLRPRPAAAVATTGPDDERPLANVSTVVQRMDTALERINRLLADEGDVEAILANFRAASADAREVAASLKDFSKRAVVIAGRADQALTDAQARVDRLGESLADNSAQLAAALDKLNRALAPVAEGRGAVGRALHDPALYESLLLSADRLNQTLAELQQLVRQWQQDGMKLKLK